MCQIDVACREASPSSRCRLRDAGPLARPLALGGRRCGDWMVPEVKRGPIPLGILLGLLAGFLLSLGCPQKEEPAPPPSEEPEGRVERVEGEAFLHRTGTRAPVHLRLGDPLFQGDLVMTHGSASIEIRLVDGSVLMLRPLSRLKLNERMPGGGEAPSVMLFSGRVLSRVLSLTGEDLFSVETPTLVARARGTEFEVGVSEDLGGLIAVYHGKVEVDTGVEPVILGPQKELEIEFMEGPSPARPFKEKGETDWAAWMMSRSRALAARLPMLGERIPARITDLRLTSEEAKSTLIGLLGEMETLRPGISEARAKGDSRALEELVRRFQGCFAEHRRCVKRLQLAGNRTEALCAHAEHLISRAKGMKKEMGERYGPVAESLKRIQEGKRELLGKVEEDRVLLRQHRKEAGGFLEAFPEARRSAKTVDGPRATAEPKKERVVPQQMRKGPSTPSRRPSSGPTQQMDKAKRYSSSPRRTEKKATDQPQDKGRSRSPTPRGSGGSKEEKAR